MAEAGHDGGEQRQARLEPQAHDELTAVGAKRPQLVGSSAGSAWIAAMVMPGDQRRGDQHLSDDHAAHRVDEVQRSQRPAAKQHEGHDQADDHRGQRHAGVDDRGRRSLAAEAQQPERGAGRDADGHRDRRGGQRHDRRARHQLPQERGRRRAHCAAASGWNSAWPYWRLPNRPISFWVGALVIQSENALAQPTLVPGCLTTITW